MRRGSKEVITGDWEFQGKAEFKGKVVFKTSPFFPREVAYIPSFTGFGIVTAINFTAVRIENRGKVRGWATTGTPTATEGRISLPTGWTSDSALYSALSAGHAQVCGTITRSAAVANSSYCLIEPGVTYITVGFQSATTASWSKLNGNTFAGTGETLTFDFDIAISGWNI